MGNISGAVVHGWRGTALANAGFGAGPFGLRIGRDRGMTALLYRVGGGKGGAEDKLKPGFVPWAQAFADV